MKGKYLLFAGFFVLLSGCAGQHVSTGPKPYLSSDVIVVPANKRRDYWEMERLTHLPAAATKPMCARVQVIIDSHGHLFDPKLMEAKGGKEAYALMLAFMSHMYFKPAKTNPRRIPIRTEISWSFGGVSLPASRSATKERLAAVRRLSCRADPTS